MAKVLEQGPILMLTFQAQQLTLKKNGDSLDVSKDAKQDCWHDQIIQPPLYVVHLSAIVAGSTGECGLLVGTM